VIVLKAVVDVGRGQRDGRESSRVAALSASAVDLHAVNHIPSNASAEYDRASGNGATARPSASWAVTFASPRIRSRSGLGLV
jgi:hypothetical protein